LIGDIGPEAGSSLQLQTKSNEPIKEMAGAISRNQLLRFIMVILIKFELLDF
jgi:hypothetical protein